MSLEVFVPAGLAKALDGEQWWAAIERHAPRAMLPVAVAMKATAPKGKTGKLSRGFDLRTKQVRQGLVRGVEVQIGARVPYGHLVERGHQVIARGPQRKGITLTRERRKELRTALKARRASGAIGHVPGRFFARDAVEQRRGQIMSLLERLVAQDMLR